MTYWLDTSALVKRYVNETGSAWVRSLFDPQAGNDNAILTLASVELASALTRKVNAGQLTASQRAALLAVFHADASDYLVTAADSQVGAAVALVERHGLRAYDAVQLAGALDVSGVLQAGGLAAPVLVSGDRQLLAAALAEGLVVEDPNQH